MKKICLYFGLFTILGSLLFAQTVTNGKVISWPKITEYIDGSLIESNNIVKYNVYRANKADLSDAVLLAGGLTNSIYIDNTISNRASYYYFCTAYINIANPSDNSNILPFNTNPPKPPVIK